MCSTARSGAGMRADGDAVLHMFWVACRSEGVAKQAHFVEQRRRSRPLECHGRARSR